MLWDCCLLVLLLSSLSSIYGMRKMTDDEFLTAMLRVTTLLPGLEIITPSVLRELGENEAANYLENLVIDLGDIEPIDFKGVSTWNEPKIIN